MAHVVQSLKSRQVSANGLQKWARGESSFEHFLLTMAAWKRERFSRF